MPPPAPRTRYRTSRCGPATHSLTAAAVLTAYCLFFSLLPSSPVFAQPTPSTEETVAEIVDSSGREPTEIDDAQETGGNETPQPVPADPASLIKPPDGSAPVVDSEPVEPQPAARKEPPAPAIEPEPGMDTALSEKLGPARIEMEAGYLDLKIAFQIIGTVISTDTGDDHDTSFKAEPRRFRLYPSGSFLDDRLRFGVQLSTTPVALEVLDWWMDGRLLEHVAIRLGQFKIPFTQYRQGSFSNRLLVDWGNVTRAFGAERQIGLMLHNGGARPEWEYAIGLFHGQNSRKAHGVGPADVYAVKLASPSDLRDPGPLEERWHPELAVRLQHNSEGIDTFAPTDKRRGELRHAFALSATWDNLPYDPELTTRNDLLRVAPEMLLKWMGVAAVAVVYLGVERTAAEQDTTLGMLGWLAELAYRFDRTWELSARFSRVDFLKALRNDARRLAEARIAAAAGTEEEETAMERYEEAGASQAAQELAVGLNVYIVESDLKLQTDLGLLTEYLDRADARNDFRWRTQLQLAF